MKFLIVAMAVLASTLSLDAHATTVLYKSFENLVDESDHVVGGTVLSIKAKYHRDGEIYTTIILKPAFIISEKGKTLTRKPIKIRYLGGEVEEHGENGGVIGGEGSHLSGTPELDLGEDVILFLSHNGRADMPIYGWGQGVFHIHESGGVHNATHAPVIGLDGPHFVHKTSRGLSSNRKPSKHTLDKGHTTIAPDSEDGEDISTSQEGKNDIARDSLSGYSAIHLSNFVSMIQERKAITKEHKTKKHKPKKHRSHLFTLPEIGSRIRTHVSVKAHDHKEGMPAATDHAVDKIEQEHEDKGAAFDAVDDMPVEPLRRPEQEDRGE